MESQFAGEKSKLVSQFLTPLWLEHVDGNVWIVCADFKYYSAMFSGIFVVPIGTETDLASIPWVFRRILPKSGKYNPAAVLHDTGYHGKLLTQDGMRINLIKKYCDLLFLEAMEVAGVGDKIKTIMYEMVKSFGKQKVQIYNRLTPDELYRKDK